MVSDAKASLRKLGLAPLIGEVEDGETSGMVTKRPLYEGQVRRRLWIRAIVPSAELARADAELSFYINSHSRGEIFRGYISKRGAIAKTWKQRLFVLTDRKLVYYAVSGSVTQQKGEVSLVGSTVNIVGPESCFGRSHGFTMTGKGYDLLYKPVRSKVRVCSVLIRIEWYSTLLPGSQSA